MQKKNLLISVFVLLLMAGTSILFSTGCNSEDKQEIVDIIVKDSVAPTQRIMVTAFDATANDSLSGFNINVVSPKGTNDYVSTGKKFFIDNVVTGNYAITVSKSGYVSSNKGYNLTVSNLKIFYMTRADFYLTKSSNAVNIPIAAGATISGVYLNIAKDGNNAIDGTTAAVANFIIPSGTVILLNGTAPTSLSITATPVITERQIAANQSTTNTIKATSTSGLFSSPIKSIDFQPEGLTFSKPVRVRMYIGDVLEKGSSYGVLNAQFKKGLVFVNVKKDGTKETVPAIPPTDPISADTIYFDIFHSGKWDMTNSSFSKILVSTYDLTLQTVTYSAFGSGGAGDFVKVVKILNSNTGSDDSKYLAYLLRVSLKSKKLFEAEFQKSSKFEIFRFFKRKVSFCVL